MGACSTPPHMVQIGRVNLFVMFLEKEFVIIEILDFSGSKMRDKMAISAYILEKSGKGPLFKTSNQS